MAEYDQKARPQTFTPDDCTMQMEWIVEKLACLWQQYYARSSLGDSSSWSYAGIRGELYKHMSSKINLAYPAKRDCPLNERTSKVTVDVSAEGVTQLNLHLIQEWGEGFNIVKVEERIRQHVFSTSLLFISL
jgi:hypothetical protein